MTALVKISKHDLKRIDEVSKGGAKVAVLNAKPDTNGCPVDTPMGTGRLNRPLGGGSGSGSSGGSPGSQSGSFPLPQMGFPCGSTCQSSARGR